MKVSDFTFDLPEELIAQDPLSGQAINALKDYETNYKKKKI